MALFAVSFWLSLSFCVDGPLSLLVLHLYLLFDVLPSVSLRLSLTAFLSLSLSVSLSVSTSRSVSVSVSLSLSLFA